MSEWNDGDFKDWLEWSISNHETVWAQIVKRWDDPEKCLRAWKAWKDWALFTVCGLVKASASA